MKIEWKSSSQQLFTFWNKNFRMIDCILSFLLFRLKIYADIFLRNQIRSLPNFSLFEATAKGRKSREVEANEFE